MFSKNRINGFGINFPHFFLIKIFFVFIYVIPATYGQVVTKNDSIPEISVRQGELVSVFLDCSRCDNAFIRQELNYINFARDPQLAQIHLFITDNETGSGGRLFTLSFIGKKEFEGTENSLTYTSTQLNTQQEERRGLTAMIELGLIPFIAQTSLADYINIEVLNRPEQEVEIEDPWNNWIFEVYGGLSFEEETSQSSLDIRYGLFADYVTETWRIGLRPYFNYNQRDYIRNEEEIRSVINRDGFQGRVVRSISDHWSLGVFTNINVNTFENIKFEYRVAPAIEYSFLPYKMALRKDILLLIV